MCEGEFVVVDACVCDMDSLSGDFRGWRLVSFAILM